jgi:hypothetical protein
MAETKKDAAEEIGSYVKAAAVKVLDTGEAQATLTIAGSQKSLERLIGKAVILENGSRKMVGLMTEFKVADKDGRRTCVAKVKGARDLDGLVGNVVKLTKSQMELPGTEE